MSLIVILTGLPYLIADIQTAGFLFAHPEVYDLQMIYTDGNWTRGMSYSIEATPQPSDCGYGFSYLENGYTSQNYWYQAGLSYDWSGGTDSFQLVYEVFGPSGLSVYPNEGGGAGLASFSKTVSQGDSNLVEPFSLGRDSSDEWVQSADRWKSIPAALTQVKVPRRFKQVGFLPQAAELSPDS